MIVKISTDFTDELIHRLTASVETMKAAQRLLENTHSDDYPEYDYLGAAVVDLSQIADEFKKARDNNGASATIGAAIIDEPKPQINAACLAGYWNI